MSTQSQNETKVTLPDDLTVVVEREFEAPRELVWECYADPDLVKEWLGPRELTMKVEEYDFRPGGKWKYIHSDGSTDYVFFGEFLELNEPEYMKQTFNFVMEPAIPPSIDELELTELEGGRTLLKTISTFESNDLREGMIQNGMEIGIREGNERLDELLERKQG
ncbi:MAG: SRPBCC domain-containing protein [Solirubrobacterales bacterium]